MYTCTLPQGERERRTCTCTCRRESEVEHFGKFMEQMKEAVMKMRAKFINHCHQMSGREWASGTCILCTHVHVQYM